MSTDKQSAKASTTTVWSTLHYPLVLTMPDVRHTGGKGSRYADKIYTIAPGGNRVPTDIWENAMKMPAMQSRVEKGMLVVSEQATHEVKNKLASLERGGKIDRIGAIQDLCPAAQHVKLEVDIKGIAPFNPIAQ